MSTFKQLLKKKRSCIKKKSRAPRLLGCPQKKGSCSKVLWIAPKKPNSANRRIAKVKLTTKRTVAVHIPGIGHSLQKHSLVLVRGGRVKDIPGMKYRAIRNKYSLDGLHNRRNGRSKYGGKAFK